MSKVVIAGGGLVGSLLSIILKKRGHDVHLFEKRSDIRKNINDKGRSINLIVTSRGLNALQKTNLLQKILELTVPVTGRMMHSINGELTYQPYGRDKTECNYSISRSELNKFLISESSKFDIPIHFEQSLTAVDFDNKEATFSSSQEAQKVTYDILIGSDGAGSILRQQIHQQSSSKNETQFLMNDYKELYMPLQNGKAPLERNALHIWPRGHHMLMALPNLDGSFTMTLYLPRQGQETSFAAIKTEKSVQEYFQKYFSDALALMPNAITDFLHNPQGALGTVKSSPWIHKDSVALIGDAAHAILPFFGQGMNCGFEDCTVLASMLDRTNENWSEALRLYDEYQRPNANAIADMALENFYEMSDKVGDQNFLFRKKIESWIENKFPEKYRSRYGMITYTLIPYHLAFEAGKIQNEIISEISKGINSVDEIDAKKAEILLNEKFLPFTRKHNINFERFKF